MFEDFPKWVAVDGPGHPQFPGHVLVSNEDEEAKAKSEGKGPADLNPPPDPGMKSLDEMTRDELIAILVREGIPEDMSDDDIRNAIRHGREMRDQHAKEDAEAAKHEAEVREAGGDHGDGMQTDQAPEADGKLAKDADDKDVSPDPADEANKVAGDAITRDAPAAKSTPGTDNTPKPAADKVADDAPAGNVTEQAATPPDFKKGSAKKTGQV